MKMETKSEGETQRKSKLFPYVLKASFGKFRDQEKYCFHSPGVHSSVV